MSAEYKDKDKPEKRMLLGELLLEKKLITQEQLDALLQEQKQTGEQLGQMLIRKRLVDEMKIYQVLAQQFGEEFVNLSELEIEKEVIALVTVDLVKEYCLIPVKKENDTLFVAMANPRDMFAIDALRRLTGLTIKPVMSARSQIKDAISKQYGGSGGGIIDEALGLVVESESDELSSEASIEALEKIKESAEQAPIIKLVDAFIQDSVRNRASDIHIEPAQKECRVRFRVDGILREVTTINRQLFAPVISRIKIISSMDIAERRLPQDGSFRKIVDDKQVDVRVSSYPTKYGEKIVMRLLVRDNFLVSLEDLGFEPDDLEIFKSLIKSPYGIFLVVGPTGSGKTTTLYASLSRINSVESNIITVEDPIEYELEGINQSQVNPKAGFTFANSLRAMMRQDPDTILVGEIRDLETAELAIRAALTGHTVFSTLHTNDAPGAVTRLVDMGIEPFLISSCLIGVLAQRLVRAICPHCKEEFNPPAALLERYKEFLQPIEGAENKFYHGKGCDHCNHSGYRGRKGVYEIFPIAGDEMKAKITAGAQSAELRKFSQQAGIRSFKQNCFRKVLQGVTTLEEALQLVSLF